MARPKAETVKEHKISARLFDEEYERLSEYAAEHNQTITQVVNDAIHMMIIGDGKVKKQS